MSIPDSPHGALVPRAVAPLLDAALRTMRVVVVTGPRQGGKSTLVRRHPKLVSRAYFSLDDARSEGGARGHGPMDGGALSEASSRR
jgi:predicted AAA+ superfamily ATPase